MSSRGDTPSPSRAVSCTHCGLPVPRGLIEPDQDEQFCCNGCQTVYETIRGCGLERYYRIVDESGEAAPATVADHTYLTFDDDAFLDAHSTADGDTHRSIELYLEGVHCAACVWLVERLPDVLDGVLTCRLDYSRRVVHLTWDPDRVLLSRIARLLNTLGYPPHPYRGGNLDAIKRRETRRHFVRIGVAGFCAGNVMLIAFGLWGGMTSGIGAGEQRLLRSVSLGLTLIALFGPGRVFLRGALSAIRTRVAHMDLPVALALVAGTAWGAVNTVTGRGEVYFESMTAVIFLLLIGRWLQDRQQRAAHDAALLVHAMAPRTARRLEASGVREIPIEALACGDRIELRAGDSVPADGVLASGTSTFDLSLLSGESRPVTLGLGAPLHAGTTNLQQRIEMTVETTGEATRLGRLMGLVEEFARERPPIVRLADRVAHWFALIVIALSAVTFAVWMTIDPEQAIENTIALLIVTCPCALGLATPLALQAAIGQAARAGILIKGGAVIEALARPGLILLDKTGTLTEGRSRVVTWTGDQSWAGRVAALEQEIAHPVATALIEYAAPVGNAENVRHTLGRGAEGRVDGHELVIGALDWTLERSGCPQHAAPELTTAKAKCLDAGLSPVGVVADGELVAIVAIGDAVHDSAADALARLRAAGWRQEILSGDHETTVLHVAERVGIDAKDAHGGATPEDKAIRVTRALETEETVVMVGDGVNDAAALAAATVGIAVHGGAEASLAAADIFLQHPGLDAIVQTMNGAQRAVAVIRRNVGISIAYNVITGSLAIAGVINPLIAAILMPISSLTVVTLSFRARTFD